VLKQINHSRIQQRRFRKDPDVYLESLENELLQLILPPEKKSIKDKRQ
jgi:hypothetical protein